MDAPAGRFGPMIEARQCFRSERVALLRLLSPLSQSQWQQPTVCPGWSVYDVAAHILGDDLGRLARSRDLHTAEAPGEDESLADFLNRFNGEWVLAARRIGPVLLMSLLEWTGSQIEEFWHGQDMRAMGEAVSWAGPGPAPVWLDAARDFSEYWTHRQQIARALDVIVDDPDDVVHTALDTFVRGVPFALRAHRPAEGTEVVVRVEGPGGGCWTVSWLDGAWMWTDQVSDAPSAEVVLDGDTAWQLWTRGIEPHEARLVATVNGDQTLADAVLEMVSIIR